MDLTYEVVWRRKRGTRILDSGVLAEFDNPPAALRMIRSLRARGARAVLFELGVELRETQHILFVAREHDGDVVSVLDAWALRPPPAA